MTTTLCTTRQLAEQRGVSRQWISQQVRNGALTPAITLANGAYLFETPENTPEATS